MGVQREPGAKGLNWSNIAVGELAHFIHAKQLKLTFGFVRCHHEYGMPSCIHQSFYSFLIIIYK